MMNWKKIALAGTSAVVATGVTVIAGGPAQAAGTYYSCVTYYSSSNIGVPLYGKLEACTVRTGEYYQARVTVSPGAYFMFNLPPQKLTWWAQKNGGPVAGATGSSWSGKGNSVLNGKWTGDVMYSKTYRGKVGDYVQFLSKVVLPSNPGPAPDAEIYPAWSPTLRLTSS